MPQRRTPPDNLTRAFFEFARTNPEKPAVVEPLRWSDREIEQDRSWSFGELATLIQREQKRLDQEGFKPGDRILILLPVSVRLYALVAACFANGLVPVFIESTISRDQFLKSIKRASPAAIFSTRQLFKYRFILPALWRSRLYAFDDNGIFLRDWERISPANQDFRPETPRSSTDETLITFTSGSTGEPKAADRRLDLLYNQREISKELWTDGENDVELTVFPLVVLNNLVHGITTVLPAINLLKLDRLPFGAWEHQIRRHKVTRLVAPPSILSLLTSPYARSTGAFSAIERSVTGGAAVPGWLMKRIETLMPNAENHVVYGSTEAEPIASVSLKEALAEKPEGYLVGKPIEEISLKLVRALNGEVDEVAVAGAHVVERYLFGSDEDQKTKIREADGRIWHRTGDVAKIDDQGRVSLRGRINDRVAGEDVYPLEHAAENLFERRAAVIGGKDGEPVLFIEDPSATSDEIKLRLEEIGYRGKFRTIIQLPVDRRHFWKIDRRKLRESL